MTEKSIEQIIEKFPNKDWFIDILNEDMNELFHRDLILTIERAIARVYACDDVVACNEELEVIYQLAWEQINTGMFKDVPTKWRKIFAIACMLLVYMSLDSLSKCMDFALLKRCLYLCDLSLMMGGELREEFNLGSLVASDLHAIMCKEKQLVIKDSPLLDEPSFDPYEFIGPDLKANLQPLERIEYPSIIEFLDILRKAHPVILTNIIDDWPALSTNKWSVDSVKASCGYRTVPVEIGSSYADSDWSQQLMTVGDFIDEYFYAPSSPSGERRIAYLAQHYLFSQIGELSRDIKMPDYCLINGNHDEPEVDINAWFGPAGTVSPLHHDPKHNFLCQIFGEKYVKLYLPTETDRLYANASTMLTNTSRVDALRPDLQAHPMFATAKGFDGFLKPGEILFIPPKCWHYVKSIQSSFSVNFWWNYI